MCSDRPNNVNYDDDEAMEDNDVNERDAAGGTSEEEGDGEDLIENMEQYVTHS